MRCWATDANVRNMMHIAVALGGSAGAGQLAAGSRLAVGRRQCGGITGHVGEGTRVCWGREEVHREAVEHTRSYLLFFYPPPGSP